MCTVRRLLYVVHCTSCNVRRTVFVMHCMMCTIPRTLYVVHCTLCTVRRTNIRYALYDVYYASYEIMHMYTVHESYEQTK